MNNNEKHVFHKDGERHGGLAGRLLPADKRYKMILIAMGLVAAVFLATLIVVNVIPPDLTLIIILIMLGMMGICCFAFSSRSRRKRIAGIAVAVIFAAVFIYGTAFMGTTYAMLSKMSATGTKATGPAPDRVDVTKEPFSVYITGIDQWAYEKGADLERSDVNMILTVNPATKKILLTSIPRDTYVKLATSQQMDKLTHSGIYGVDETLNTVRNWLGIDINYYVKLNFTGVRDIINAMGGIEVYSPVDFTSDLMGYQYKKGWNLLGGKEAVYFARERHAFEDQDETRVENQQRVVKAVIKNMTSSTTLLLRYGEVMDAAGDNLSTNLSTDEMTALARMQIAELADWDIETQRIDGKDSMDYVASLPSSQKYYVFKPSADSVASCRENIGRVLNPTEADVKAAKKGQSRSFFVNAIKRAGSKSSKKDDGDEEE